MFPKEIAVVCCPDLTKRFSKTERNNELSNKAAKAAIYQHIHECSAITNSSAENWPEMNNPVQIYADVTQEEQAPWESWEAVKDETGIRTIGGKPILPRKHVMTLSRWFHDKTHRGMTAIVNQIEKM